jgi:2-polyprenyl-3-methyl-5-hydroxy-6-metoxy-1,4-benzoquinol methylase
MLTLIFDTICGNIPKTCFIKTIPKQTKTLNKSPDAQDLQFLAKNFTVLICMPVMKHILEFQEVISNMCFKHAAS